MIRDENNGTEIKISSMENVPFWGLIQTTAEFSYYNSREKKEKTNTVAV